MFFELYLKQMSYLTSFGTANPLHCFTQKTIANFMVRTMELNEEDARKVHALYRATGIETRYSVLSDYGQETGYDFFANNGSSTFPSTKQRIELFKKYAVELSLGSIRQCLKNIHSLKKSEITHLIVVSCTGMYAPGLDIDLVKALGLNKTINRTCINFMGCYAAFNAIKLADTFCASEKNAKVLIVCTELCSIHFQKENTEDNLLANALFADGSATILVEAQPRKGVNLKPVSFHCDLATDGEQAMAWTIGDRGFEMKLSTYVPDVIRGGIKKLTKSLLEKISQNLADISYFAIHPGGKKILEAIETELNISKDLNRHAYEVLKQYGNMSSPTVLFVLNEICKTLNGKDQNKNILSFAFGPGLTLESMLLQIENH
jgi:prepilin-type processing-associated H-X9-DG protein